MLRNRLGKNYVQHLEEPVLGLYQNTIKKKPVNHTKRVIALVCVGLAVIIYLALLKRQWHPFAKGIRGDNVTYSRCAQETAIQIDSSTFYLCRTKTKIFGPTVREDSSTANAIKCDVGDGNTLSTSKTLFVTYMDKHRKTYEKRITEPIEVCTWAWVGSLT